MKQVLFALVCATLAFLCVGDDVCHTKYSNEGLCNADTSCVWCVCGALPSSCWSLEDSKKLPPAVYNCSTKVYNKQQVSDCSGLSNIKGFLIDLDGTMYNTTGLIDGAGVFYNWLVDSKIPFVFLSDTGAKGPVGVQAKFSTPPFNISSEPVDLSHIYTASTAMAHKIEDTVPDGARVYIIQSLASFSGATDSCIGVLNRTIPKKFATLDWRTDLSDTEALEWSRKAKSDPNSTYVVMCVDAIPGDTADPVTGKPGYNDWSYDLLIKATWLLTNGATFLNHAPDQHAAVFKAGFSDIDTDRPGPGSFTKLLAATTFPNSRDKMFTVGKGGNDGTKYMMHYGWQMLVAQGFEGTQDQIAMVGDTLDTDILAANMAGMSSVFVLSGVHTVADEKYYPDIDVTCVLPNVGNIATAVEQAVEQAQEGQQQVF